MQCENDQVDQYYGYNSILTQDGKRLRRLRRTELSAQKLIIMRICSPHRTHSIVDRQILMRNNKISAITKPLSYSRSKLSVKCSGFLKSHFNVGRKQIKSQHESFSAQMCRHMPSQFSSTRMQMLQKQSKNKMSQYYDGSAMYENIPKPSKKSSQQKRQRSVKSKQNIDFSMPYNRASIKSDHSDYMFNPTQPPKRKIQKCQKGSKLQNSNLLKDQSKQCSQNHQKSKGRDLIKNQSRSKLKLSQSNSKISSLSQSNRMSDYSRVSIETSEMKSKASSIIHMSQSSEFRNDYGLIDNHLIPEKYQLSNHKKKNQKKSNQSQIQKNLSKLSSVGSKIRSKIQQRREKSKLSKNSQLQSQIIEQCQQIYKNEKNKNTTTNCVAQTVKTKRSLETNESVKSFQQQIKQPLGNIKLSSNQKDKSRKIVKINKKQTNKQIQNPVQPIEVNTKLKNTASLDTNAYTQSSSRVTQIIEDKGMFIKKDVKTVDSISQSTTSPSVSTNMVQKRRQTEFTLEQFIQNIEEHDLRLGFLYLFVDNTHQTYESAIRFERYERLCFLMLKKYVYQKNRIVKAFHGGENCFTLSECEIPSEMIKKYSNTKQIQQKLADVIEQLDQITKQFELIYIQVSQKYSKDKLIKNDLTRDNFTKEIMKLLMEELTKLYQELQSEQIETDLVDQTQKRIIQIIEIMFLISELSGRQVKPFQLLEENNVDFNEYYTENYQKIIQTAQFFQMRPE